jgi:sec-independent protein translocase protein TatC
MSLFGFSLHFALDFTSHRKFYCLSSPNRLPSTLCGTYFSLTDGMFIYMKCAFVCGVLLTLPLALYHIWAFVKPGLTEKKAKGTLAFVLASFMLFLAGISFSYFVVFPAMVSFMGKVNKNVGAVETYGIDRYFSFMFNVIFPMGVAFEMPIIVVFLTKLGLLNPERLKKSRKYAYLALVIVGSSISPPDFVSHLSVPSRSFYCSS